MNNSNNLNTQDVCNSDMWKSGKIRFAPTFKDTILTILAIILSIILGIIIGYLIGNFIL